MAAPMATDLLVDEHIALLCLKYILFCYVFACLGIYVLTCANLINCEKREQFYNSTVLLIIAHPDDECMFFSPALIELSRSCSIHVLCTTAGNYYSQGAVRKKEILKSCESLGIQNKNVEVLDDSSFPDDPTATWDVTKLRQEMTVVVERIQPDYILTFDEHGVSGHPNHIAISKVIKQLQSSADSKQKMPRLYQLESVSLVRKYVSLLDLPLSLSSCHLTFISSIPDILRAQHAMYAHYSQFVWFRILYIVFSRYMVINTFVEIS